MRQEPDKTAYMARVWDAAWASAANGRGLPADLPELIHDPDVLLAAWLGFLTGQMHASADVEPAFRVGWNQGDPDGHFAATLEDDE